MQSSNLCVDFTIQQWFSIPAFAADVSGILRQIHWVTQVRHSDLGSGKSQVSGYLNQVRLVQPDVVSIQRQQ